jgi:hypothetical protein
VDGTGGIGFFRIELLLGGRGLAGVVSWLLFISYNKIMKIKQEEKYLKQQSNRFME